MKKRIIAAMMAAFMAFSLTACGSSDDSLDADKYVEIGELEGLEIPVDSYTFTDEDVANQMQQEYEYYVDMSDTYDYQEITDRTDVQEGDFCNIDYEGKKDGVAFEGGTDTGFNLEIGSNSFIDGFEEGLIGHQVGEEVDLDLTFPENYQNEEMAGAAVVFHVKINKIQTRSIPEITDESVAVLGVDYASKADFEQEVRQNLQDSCDEEMESAKTEALWAAVMDACEVKEAPQTLIDSYKEEINKNAQSYADTYGVELEEFITTYMGMEMAEFEAEVEESAKSAAEEHLVVRAIASKADLKVKKDEVKSRAEAEYAEYGYESADAFLEDIGEDNYEQYLLQEKVQEYLLGVVKFTEGEEINLISYYYGDDSEDEEVIEEDVEEVEVSENAATEDETAEDNAAEEEAAEDEAAEDNATEDVETEDEAVNEESEE